MEDILTACSALGEEGKEAASAYDPWIWHGQHAGTVNAQQYRQ